MALTPQAAKPQASGIRPAAVAGAFYSGDAGLLGEELRELLDGVEGLEPKLGHPKALIVPHAGYIYSGQTAARAYDELAAARGLIRRVVLLGPSHYVPGRGLALPQAEAFETPLGRIEIDAAGVRALADLRQVTVSAPAHSQEHSLEVQLPFLQRVLGGSFTLVPLAVSAATNEEVAEVLERLWGGPETLIVISTDLSHYHEYREAKRIDGATLLKIAAFATDLSHEEACGATPLNGFLGLAKKKGLRIRLLGACNSGDTAGGKGRVVGYSSFALYGADAVPTEEAGRTLLLIARDAIESALFQRERSFAGGGGWLRLQGATFVTLSIGGKLRGCIGSLEIARPLGEDVAANALAAAFQDPRFPKLTRDEWPACSVEVSVLSAPKPMRFADEADLLAQLRPGEDGVILEHDGKRATYLPQVWEGMPDKRIFLSELIKKAGLPADTRPARCRVSRYRVRKFA